MRTYVGYRAATGRGLLPRASTMFDLGTSRSPLRPALCTPRVRLSPRPTRSRVRVPAAATRLATRDPRPRPFARRCFLSLQKWRCVKRNQNVLYRVRHARRAHARPRVCARRTCDCERGRTVDTHLRYIYYRFLQHTYETRERDTVPRRAGLGPAEPPPRAVTAHSCPGRTRRHEAHMSVDRVHSSLRAPTRPTRQPTQQDATRSHIAR